MAVRFSCHDVHMAGEHRTRVLSALHESRMQPYLHAASGNVKKALALYVWNLRLTAAVQEVLGVTEVVLRNAMDRQLLRWNRDNGGDQDSWLMEPPQRPLRALIEGKRKSARDWADKQASARPEDHWRHGVAVCHDDVLAQVMFGMWKDLLPNHAVDASPSSQANINRATLWEDALHYAFPHVEDAEGAMTYWRVANLHRLRNRVSHMEPLINVDVPDEIKTAFDLVGSIDPSVRDWISSISRVQDVWRARPK